MRTSIRTAVVVAGLCLLDAAPRGTAPVSPEDLQVVDCLLPGQVRKLGRNQTFVTQRRPVRTTTLDCQIRGGEYVAYDRANYATALKVWMASAEAGDAEAQYFVGEIYERGLGTEPDYRAAAAWYRKAAEQGHAPAQINLGFLLEKGLGVEADPKQALEWYRKSSGVSGVILLDSDLEAIRKETSEAQARVEQAQQSARELEGQLEATRRDLAAERSSKQRSAARVAELEARVSSLGKTLGTRQEELARMERPQAGYDVAGPTIEVVNVAAVRGTRPEASEPSQVLVGKVHAPAGLATFLANERTESVGEDGFFKVRPDAGRIVFVAIDRQGKRAELVYDVKEGAPLRKKDATPSAKLGRYRALVIGIDAYAHMPRLATAVKDSRAVAALLESRYGFKTTVLQDASYFALLSAFHALRQELTEADNLLIYYAGHGEIDSGSGLGYWIPADGQKERKINWMSSEEISEQLSLLPAKHILVVADSCYSGALTRSSLGRIEDAPAGERSRWLKEVASRRSRTALTSGGLNPVLDTGGSGHSIFSRVLLDVLSKNSDVLATDKLWAAVRARVEYETKALGRPQVPEYAPIRFAGHGSGEFFFPAARG